MIKLKILRIFALFLILSSLTIGFMLDCVHFYDRVEVAVSSSFSIFILGMFLLIYVNDKFK